jgi:DNA polymerase II small subunit
MSKEKLVSFFFERNYMVTPALIQTIPEKFDYNLFFEKNTSLGKAETITVVSADMFDFSEFVVTESVSVVTQVEEAIQTSVEVVDSYVDKPKKREVKDFVEFFKVRYKALRKILLQRGELQGAVSISKAKGKQEREPVAIIGLVYDIGVTKNGHYMLELEDLTGRIKVLISVNNPELFELGNQIVKDEVIGISGSMGSDIIFSKVVVFPDIPLKEYKKSKDDVSVAFISDLHIGSKFFAKKEFERFIDWLNLRHGTDEQLRVARKVKYLVIVGDLIEGVGIYPGQKKELNIDDIYKQYECLAGYLGSLREDIKIVISGGNHDALRLAEPQPPLSEDFARSLYKLKNLIHVSNPSTVRIHSMFDILLYHGYCFDYYMNNVDFIRAAGGYEATETMMEFALRKRHLAPTHISALYIPDVERDFRIIKKVPDFFVTGHIHYDVKVKSYRNVTLVGNSSFQYKTDFQEKMGHMNIVWGKVAVINLKSRNTTIMDFRDKEEKK